MENKNENVQENGHKLIKIRSNGFMVKLCRFSLGNLAPDTTMVNYCPIFWLFICSVIIFIPVAIIRLIVIIVKAIGWILRTTIFEPLERGFMETLFLNDEKIMRFEYKRSKGFNERDSDLLPWYVNKRNFWDEYDRQIDEYANEKGKSVSDLRREFKERYREVLEKIKEKRRKQLKRISLPSIPRPKFVFAKRISFSISKFRRETKEKVAAQKKLIKFAKGFSGVLISLILATALYFVVIYMTRGIIWVIEVWNWGVCFEILIGLGIFVGVIVAIALIVLGFVSLVKWLYANIPPDNFLFRILRVLVVIPLYYLFVGFIWNILIVGFIWNIVLVSFLWNILINWLLYRVIVRSIIAIGPLFKEYMGKEYTSMCPGVEWVEE